MQLKVKLSHMMTEIMKERPLGELDTETLEVS